MRTVLTVSRRTATEVAALAETAGFNVTAVVVGSPTLEQWADVAANATLVRAARQQACVFPDTLPIAS